MGSHGEDERKIPLCLQQDNWERKRPEIFPVHSVLNKACPQEKLFY